MALNINDRVRIIAHRSVQEFATLGTITAVHPVPGFEAGTEYSIQWDDNSYPDAIWSEYDLDPSYSA